MSTGFPAAAREALGNAQLRRNLGKATTTIRAKRANVVSELPDWEALRDADALAVARVAALNLASSGACVVGLAGGPHRGEAILTGWPNAEALALCDLTAAEADRFLGVFRPIAAYLGLRFAARRDGERIALTFAR